MEVVYRFTFEEGSDDSYETYLIGKRHNMSLALWDLSQKIREWDRHDNRSAIPTEEILNTFYDIMSDNDINLDKLCL